MKDMKVRITFLRSVLGTLTGDKDLYRNYIGDKAPDAKTLEEEVAAIGVEGAVEKGKTFFPKNSEGKAFIYDYQIRGFFKSACSALSKVQGTIASNVKAFKKKIDTTIFVRDRENVITGYTEITECQRPLRASTPQGERVSIAISEEIAEGAQVEFTVRCLIDGDVKLVEELLGYGQYNGLCQWRNSGHGSFSYEILDCYEVGVIAEE